MHYNCDENPRNAEHSYDENGDDCQHSSDEEAVFESYTSFNSLKMKFDENSNLKLCP